MDFISPSRLEGHRVTLQRTDPRHLPGLLETPGAGAAGFAPGATGSAASPEEGFAAVLSRALNGVNEQQKTAMEMTQAMVTDPDSVDVHDVTLALAEANLSLSIAKAVMDRVIRAYQEIINVR